jgi:phage terminase large subunit-like protein
MSYFIPEELLPPPKQSWKSVLAKLPEEKQRSILAALSEEEVIALNQDWFLSARREQFPPPHMNWFIWIILAGRGFGKTWSGANWILNEHQFGGAKESAIVAATSSDLRRNCVEGPSGLIQIAPPWFRPDHKPTQNKIVWPNGTVTHLYTSEKPERLRGPNHDRAWCDEMSYWRYVHQVWDNLMMTMRYGSDNKCVITMTPRPIRIIKDFQERRDVIFSRGSSYDNLSNLSGEFAEIIKKYKGTHLERQEIYGEITGDVDGALWSRAIIDANRVDKVPSKMNRVVIGVDPSITGGQYADEAGIVAAGLVGGKEPHGYVLGDYSLRGSPEKWAKKAVWAYHHHSANLIIAERNQGGEMVGEVLKNVDASVPVKLVHASKGKVARAEPVALLDEQHQIHHVGVFPEMEDEMASFVPGDITESPNRVDARVWALSHLMVKSKRGGTWGRRFSKRKAA